MTLKRFFNYLGSLRFTLFLILSLALIFLLGLWIPQKALLQRELYQQWQTGSPSLVAALELAGLTNIYTSPVTLTLWGLFFLNLAMVTSKRLPLLRQRIALNDSKLEDPATSPNYPYKAEIELPEAAAQEKIPELLSDCGYNFYGTSQHYYAVKNRLSPLASLFFHLSFFLILLGGVITVYTKFTGYVELAEGESFAGEMERYIAPVRLPKLGNPPDARFTIQSIRPEGAQGIVTAFRVAVVDDAGKTHVADVNRPYRSGFTSFVIKNLGVAPLFVIKDLTGREVDGAYLKLNVVGGKQDSFTLLGYRFIAVFYSDYFIRDGVEGSRTDDFNNPAFHLIVEKNDRKIAEQTVRLHESIEFDGYSMSFSEMPFFTKFYVVKESGLGIVYAGFAVITVALIWRLIFYRREMIGAVRLKNGKPLLVLAGRSEFYKALSEEEFEKVVAGLSAKLGNEDTGRKEKGEL